MKSKRTATHWVGSSLLLMAAVVGSALSASSVAAQAVTSEPTTPAQCTARPRHIEKFRSGFISGKQKADNIWTASDVGRDAKKLRRKLSRVLDRLHDHVREVISSDASDGKRCRVQGVAEGFVFRLAQLLGECVLDGAQWAQFSANMYCELSIELAGLGNQGQFFRAPAGLCGSLFERVCDNGYAYVATEGQTALQPAVKQFLQQRAVTLTPFPGCQPYTVSPHDVAFEEAVNLDCAYNPP
jgi:hypothetical protein